MNKRAKLLPFTGGWIAYQEIAPGLEIESDVQYTQLMALANLSQILREIESAHDVQSISAAY